MAEAEWLACEDPIDMLSVLPGEVHERKFRLFACACCRRLWHFLADESRHAIQVTERYAGGDATADDLLRAYLGAYPGDNLVHRLAASDDQFDVLRIADHAAEWVGGYSDIPSSVELAEHAAQSRIVREVFGNPFRPANTDWVWRTPTVTSLALAAYEKRALPSGDLDLHYLAILADVLEEVGWNDAEILSHLRSAGPHVRGCWALDRILGKA